MSEPEVSSIDPAIADRVLREREANLAANQVAAETATPDGPAPSSSSGDGAAPPALPYTPAQLAAAKSELAGLIAMTNTLIVKGNTRCRTWLEPTPPIVGEEAIALVEMNAPLLARYGGHIPHLDVVLAVVGTGAILGPRVVGIVRHTFSSPPRQLPMARPNLKSDEKASSAA